jgi:glucose-1-phosphate thymidylyltransferase
VSGSAAIENSVIIAPCFIGEGVKVINSVVGPYVSLEAGVVVEDSRVEHTIIQSDTSVKNARLKNSLLGKNVTYIEKQQELSLGDFSTQI